MSDIDIGIKILPNIYLHALNEGELPFQFDASKIIEVKESENGSIVVYKMDKEETGVAEYLVTENKQDVEDAINEAMGYKKIIIKYINSFLEK